MWRWQVNEAMLKFNIQIVKHTERRERNICERVRLRDSFQFNENYLEKEITDSLRFFFFMIKSILILLIFARGIKLFVLILDYDYDRLCVWRFGWFLERRSECDIYRGLKEEKSARTRYMHDVIPSCPRMPAIRKQIFLYRKAQ